jgi:hypothetical protein
MKRLLAIMLAVGLVAASVVPAGAGHRGRGHAIRRGGVSFHNHFSYGMFSPVVFPRFASVWGYYASPTYFYQAPVLYSPPVVYQAPVVCPPAYECPPDDGWTPRERVWVPGYWTTNRTWVPGHWE